MLLALFAALATSSCDDDVDSPPRPQPMPGESDASVGETLTAVHTVAVGVNPLVTPLINRRIAEGYLEQASNLLMNRVDGLDTTCCVRFELDELRMNNTLPISIGSPRDLLTLDEVGSAVTGAFTVVQGIGFCSGDELAPNQAIAGCTARNRIPSVIARRWRGVEVTGDTWAHEFGHAQGIVGDAPCAPIEGFAGLMESACADGVVQERVSQDECQRFRIVRPENESEAIITSEGNACGQ